MMMWLVILVGLVVGILYFVVRDAEKAAEEVIAEYAIKNMKAIGRLYEEQKKKK